MLLASALTIASCTNDDDIAQNSSRNALDIKVAVQNIAGSRAMVFGQTLPAGSEIGVCVVADADGGNYDGITTGYTNVAYRAAGESTAQTWGPADASKQILLSGTPGKAIAYYPYASTVTDYTAIPVDIADQTDWMYSGEVGPLTDAAPLAEFVMNHALTALNVNFVRDAAYTGEGEVTALTVTSDGLATNGTFSAVDGAFASTSGAGSAVSVIDAAFTLTSGAANQENPYMFVPTTDETKDFTVTATVDGKAYNVGVAMNEAFAPGKMYKLNVKVTNTGLTVSKVTLVDWNIDTSLPEGTLQPEVTPSEPVEGTIDLKTAPNGVYAIAQNGLGVTLADADETCIAVALIENSHKFAIYKYNAQDVDGNKELYWGHNINSINDAQIQNINSFVDGFGAIGSEYDMDYNSWNDGPFSDFDGKANTTAMFDAYVQNDVEMLQKDICKVLKDFNLVESNENRANDWYIPSLGQLGLIFINIESVENMLSKIGGELLKYFSEELENDVDGYWSSTGYGYTTGMYNGWTIWFGSGQNNYLEYPTDCSFARFIRDID